MGAWGTALFSDDTACDIRDEWINLYALHGDADESASELLTAHAAELQDPDVGPVIWLALAVTQWKHGCLLPELLTRALQVIDNGEGLDLWEDEGPALLKARRKVYEKIRVQLTSPQPPLKKVKRKVAEHTYLQPGQLVRFTLRNGEYALLLVRSHYKYKGAILPECVLYDWAGTEVPAPDEIRKLKPILRKDAHLSAKFYIDIAEAEGKSDVAAALRERAKNLVYSPYALRGSGKAHYPAERIAVIAEGVDTTLEGRAGGPSIMDWSDLDAVFRNTGPAPSAPTVRVGPAPAPWTPSVSKELRTIIQRATALANEPEAARSWPQEDGALILKRSRTPAAPGDLIAVNLRGRRWVAGRVVCTDATVLGTGEYVVYFYDMDVPDPLELRPPIKPKLLIPPVLGGKRGWTTGSIVTLGNAPLQPEELLTRHIFECSFRSKDKHCDEYGVNVAPPGPEDIYVSDQAWSWPGGSFYELMKKLGIPTPRDGGEVK